MVSKTPRWIVPLASGTATITVDDGLSPPGILLEMPPLPIASAMQATQLGQALCDAAKHAAQLRLKKRRGA